MTRTSLPVRRWLWLLIVAVVAVPALTTAALIAWWGPPPPDLSRIDEQVDPALWTEIGENVSRWDDPAWQARLEQRLATAGVEAMLIDAAGGVVYRSTGWSTGPVPGPGAAESPSVPLTVSLTPPGGGGALALLRPTSPDAMPSPEPPWFSTSFWRIPLAQMAALLLIVGAIALFVTYAFLRPLSRMVEAMRRVGAGDLNARLPRSRVAEVDETATAFAAMADALRVSLERQEALEQERRMTISAVVHDLRTPLFSLRGYLTGLEQGLADSPEKVARYVRISREKADALERLVSDLFSYTRTEFLEEVLRPEALDLGDLLRRTVEGLQPQAEAKGVRLVLESAGEAALVKGDPLLLMRAVENVLDNAVRYTPPGGEVRVAWRPSATGVAFTVSDSGPGIAAADLPHLFAPLYRGEASRNRRTGGAGLGLTIARRLLRAHGGDLTAANIPHGGAVFTGTLPTPLGGPDIAGEETRQRKEPAMHAFIALILITAALLFAPGAGAEAAEGTPAAETPPESCLAVETFPVLPGEHPHDVAPAADGERIWYTAQRAGALGLLDPASGEIETIPLGEGSAPHGVIVGPDGAAWATDGGLNAIVRVDAETHEVAVWPLAGENANLNTAVFDGDGVLWYTGQNGIVGRLDPAATPPGTVLEPVAAPRGQGPYGIAVTPQNEVYFASLAGSYLGRVVPGADGSFTLEEIEPPTAAQGTRRVWSDTAGILWTSEWNAGQVGRYDPVSGEWQEWRLPGSNPQAYAVYVDERDDVWLSDFGANALVRFDPDTETFSVLPLPHDGARVRQLHGRSGEVWGAESGVDALVRVTSTC